MPKVTYTKAKGLIQESGTGFIHTEVPLVQEAKVAVPKMPIHVITVGADGNSIAATDLHNAVITVRLADGSKKSLVLNAGTGATLLTLADIPGGGEVTNVVLSGPTAHADIADDIGKAIAGLGSSANTEYAYKVAAGSAGSVLTLAGLKPHNHAIPDLVITLGEHTGGSSNAKRSNSALVVLDLNSGSSLGSDNSLPSNSKNPALVSQVKAATSVVFDCHAGTDIVRTGYKVSGGGAHGSAASFALRGLTLEDGTAVGQRCFLVNRSSNRTIIISGKFNDAETGTATDTTCTLAKATSTQSSVQGLIWNGSRWSLGPHNVGNPLGA